MMYITLPDELKAHIDGLIACGRYANAEEFVLTVIRADEESFDHLDALIQEGLDSGMTDLNFDEVIAQARARSRSGMA